MQPACAQPVRATLVSITRLTHASTWEQWRRNARPERATARLLSSWAQGKSGHAGVPVLLLASSKHHKTATCKAVKKMLAAPGSRSYTPCPPPPHTPQGVLQQPYRCPHPTHMALRRGSTARGGAPGLADAGRPQTPPPTAAAPTAVQQGVRVVHACWHELARWHGRSTTTGGQ